MKKKKVKTKRPAITETHFPLIKKPMEQLGKKAGFPGDYWTLRSGRMSEEEKNKVNKKACTPSVEKIKYYAMFRGKGGEGN